MLPRSPLALLGLMVGGGSQLSAQVPVDSAVAAESDTGAYRLPELVVEATRGESDANRVPLAVSLVEPTDVFGRVGYGLDDALGGNETDPADTFGEDTLTAINPLLEPIISTTVELGTRHAVVRRERGLLRALAYDAALYLTRVRNEIVPYRGGSFYFTAGRARRVGAELGLRVGLSGGVSAAASVTWLRNTYTEYVVDSVHYGRPGRQADFSGNLMVGVPGWIVGAQVAVEPTGLRALRFQVDVEGNSRYFADDANTVSVEGFMVASLTAGLRRPVAVGGVTAGGFVAVHNLFDRRYVASAYLNPDRVAGEPVALEPGLPRRLVLAVEMSL